MFILAFDTTSEFVSIALIDINTNHTIYTNIYKQNGTNADILMTCIESSLIKNNITYDDISIIACINGPSSFIRVRICISAMYGLQFVLKNKIKFMTVNLFELYSFHYDMKLNECCIILHAFGSNYYISNADGASTITINELSEIKHSNILCDKKSSQILNTQHLRIINIDNYALLCGQYIYSNKNNALSQDIRPYYLMTPEYKKVIK